MKCNAQNRSWAAALMVSGLLALAGSARAESQVSITGNRILLRDVVPAAESAVGGIDLGRAPSPGNSRLLVREEIVRALRDAGASTQKLQIPELVRVTSARRRLSAEELSTQVAPWVRAKLRHGVRLKSVVARAPVDTSPSASVVGVSIPEPPHREGTHPITVVAELASPGGPSQRVALTATVEISAAAARADLPRGTQLRLVIRRSGAEIGADAVALTDSRLGEVAQFKVLRTGRILKARLESPEVAVVVQP